MVSLPHLKVSSCKPYPIAHYVTCDKFSNAHKCYLAIIEKIMEPRFFHEVVPDQNEEKPWTKTLKP